jgi:hypothetical protein
MSDIYIRAPKPAELFRVMPLFGRDFIPPGAQVLVAAKSKPLERFVGATAGWQAEGYAKILLAWLPGSARQETASALVKHVAESARAGGFRHLMYGKLLAEDSESYALLKENGFAIMHSERYFRVQLDSATNRVDTLMARFQAEVPGTWHTEPIRHRQPEEIFDLIAPHHLMMPEEVRAGWNPDSPSSFALDASSIIYDGKAPFGVLLIRRFGEMANCEVRVVEHSDLRLRGLANLVLFHHCHHNYPRPADHARWLIFRAGLKEHLETANTAFRLGGTELSPRHLLYLAL